MADLVGLDQLEQRRSAAASGRAKRNVPPAKHPKAAVQHPAEAAVVAEEHTARRVAGPQATEPEPANTETDSPPAPVRRRSRVRPTQVHLDEASEEHLASLKKLAVMSDVALTSSAVLRMALAELVERYSYQRIVEMFADDPHQPRPGRPRH
jgi:hypothetical protein